MLRRSTAFDRAGVSGPLGSVCGTTGGSTSGSWGGEGSGIPGPGGSGSGGSIGESGISGPGGSGSGPTGGWGSVISRVACMRPLPPGSAGNQSSFGELRPGVGGRDGHHRDPGRGRNARGYELSPRRRLVSRFRDQDITLPLWRIHRHIGMGSDQLVGALAGDDVERTTGEDIRVVGSRALFASSSTRSESLPGARLADAAAQG